MTTIKAFIKRHPVLTYYALTFAISWGGVLLVIGGPGGIPGTKQQFDTLIILWGGLLGFVVMAYMIIATAYGSYQPVRERSESPKQA